MTLLPPEAPPVTTDHPLLRLDFFGEIPAWFPSLVAARMRGTALLEEVAAQLLDREPDQILAALQPLADAHITEELEGFDLGHVRVLARDREAETLDHYLTSHVHLGIREAPAPLGLWVLMAVACLDPSNPKPILYKDIFGFLLTVAQGLGLGVNPNPLGPVLLVCEELLPLVGFSTGTNDNDARFPVHPNPFRPRRPEPEALGAPQL